MLDTAGILEDKIARYKKDIDNPNTINGFNGTFQISDHQRIAEPLREYLMYKFNTARLRKVPIEDINDALNEVWEGPGSLEKILRLAYEMGPHVNFTASMMPTAKKALVEDDPVDAPLAKYGSGSDFDKMQDEADTE